MKRKGISMAEVVLAICICFMAFMVFMSVFSSASRATIQSRDRTAAILLANTLMEEIDAHPYGSPPPQWWFSPVDHPLNVWVEGRRVQMDFHKELKFKNQSCVGNATGDEDEVTITISWREASGDKQSPVVNPDDNKVLQITYPVWRMP